MLALLRRVATQFLPRVSLRLFITPLTISTHKKDNDNIISATPDGYYKQSFGEDTMKLPFGKWLSLPASVSYCAAAAEYDIQVRHQFPRCKGDVRIGNGQLHGP